MLWSFDLGVVGSYQILSSENFVHCQRIWHICTIPSIQCTLRGDNLWLEAVHQLFKVKAIERPSLNVTVRSSGFFMNLACSNSTSAQQLQCRMTSLSLASLSTELIVRPYFQCRRTFLSVASLSVGLLRPNVCSEDGSCYLQICKDRADAAFHLLTRKENLPVLPLLGQWFIVLSSIRFESTARKEREESWSSWVLYSYAKMSGTLRVAVWVWPKNTQNTSPMKSKRCLIDVDFYSMVGLE